MESLCPIFNDMLFHCQGLDLGCQAKIHPRTPGKGEKIVYFKLQHMDLLSKDLLNVHNKTKASIIALIQLVRGFIKFSQGCDHLGLADDVVLGAKVHALLSLGHTANITSGYIDPARQQVKVV